MGIHHLSRGWRLPIIHVEIMERLKLIDNSLCSLHVDQMSGIVTTACGGIDLMNTITELLNLKECPYCGKQLPEITINPTDNTKWLA